MARTGGIQRSGWNSVLALVAIVILVWGLERWRRDAARRAGGSERARLVSLARCLLGPDGTTVMRSPEVARQRLRALAMAAPPGAAITWFDRCMPLARALALHASEVDNTSAPTSAQTRMESSTRRLAEAVTRVGLVWRVRSGDPETDMDAVAEHLARVAMEIDLAGAPPRGVDADAGPVAPPPPALPAGALVPTLGLEPAPLGGPTRFVAGAPLPALAEVIEERGAWRVETLANQRALAWSATGAMVARIDARTGVTPDGLAPLRVFRPFGAPPVEVRVAPVDDPLAGIHVAMDAVSTGRVLWLAQWTPWTGATLSRFAPGRDVTAVVLAPPQPGAAARATDPVRGASTAFDEHVAVAPLGAGVVVAYTQQQGPGRARLTLAGSLADSDRAPIDQLAQREVAGARPSVEFCRRPDGALLLVVAAAREWLALRVDAGEVSVLARAAAAGHGFDERLVVRCTRDALLAYGREHARSSPVLLCRAPDRCETLAAPEAPTLSTMPLYTTRNPTGRALAHGEWPVALAAAGEVLLAARASGPVVTVTRRPPGGVWADDRVVFDAAARTHGFVVEGLGLYAEGNRATLAVAAPDGLHLFVSDDQGTTWR